MARVYKIVMYSLIKLGMRILSDDVLFDKTCTIALLSVVLVTLGNVELS